MSNSNGESVTIDDSIFRYVPEDMRQQIKRKLEELN